MFNKKLQAAVATAILTIFVAGPLMSARPAEASSHKWRNRWEDHRKNRYGNSHRVGVTYDGENGYDAGYGKGDVNEGNSRWRNRDDNYKHKHMTKKEKENRKKDAERVKKEQKKNSHIHVRNKK